MSPTHKRHPSDGPVVHDGPGHPYGDPSWCGGCWWEMEGQYRPPLGPWDRHADDCPGCDAAAPSPATPTNEGNERA